MKAGQAIVAVLLLLGVAVWAAAEDYEVGSGDTLRIEVIGRPEMTDTFEVDGEGLINYWEVGRVKAAGYTTKALADKLITLLVEGRYMRRPQVRVSVAEYGSQRVYVAGEVQRQGYYALKADRSLRGFMSVVPFNATAGHDVIIIRASGAGRDSLIPSAVEDLAEVHDQTPIGPDDGLPNPDLEPGEPDEDEGAGEEDPPPAPIQIVGLPPIDPSNEVLRLNLLELQVGGPGNDVQLQAGDTVFVPRAAQVYVTGAVSRPGAFRYEPGMNVLQALTLAGGVAARGSEGGTRVVRIVDGKKVKQKVKPTDRLQPEDRLEVPERFF